MSLDLFFGIPVTDFATSLAWYERLLGAPPTFFATETEAVWELAEHRWVYVEQRPERAGHALLSILVADLDARVAQVATRASSRPGGKRSKAPCARRPSSIRTATSSASAMLSRSETP